MTKHDEDVRKPWIGLNVHGLKFKYCVCVIALPLHLNSAKYGFASTFSEISRS
jgi:hypothetical protein